MQLDTDLLVSDIELDVSNNYSGAFLFMLRDTGVNAEDVFGFVDGNGLSLSGSDILKNSQSIATFNITSTAGLLQVTFTDANGETPTQADVTNVLHQLTYANSSNTPPASVPLKWYFNDDNTGAQGSGGQGYIMTTSTVNITSINDVPTADAGGPYAIAEGDSLTLDSSASSDPEGDSLTYRWDLNNNGVYDEIITTGSSATVNWSTLQSAGIDDDGSYTVGLQVDDGNGGIVTTTTTLTVTNTAPTLSTTGANSVAEDAVYTLNLGAADPGNDTISSWTISWGDGTIETVAGNPSSVTHGYARPGFTYDILAAATDEDGTFLQNQLLVASFNNDRILRFEPTTGAPIDSFGTGNGLDSPIDLVLGPDGLLYVSGYQSHDIQRFNPQTGAFVDKFVTPGSAGLLGPTGIAFGPDGNLYVSDYSRGDVYRFDGGTGAFIDKFITKGTGGLNTPEGIVFGPDGNLYIADYDDSEILRFDGQSGAFIDTFVTAGSGTLQYPEQITFGPDGSLYVASDNNKVLRFDGNNGGFIDEFIPAGTGGLTATTGVAFGPDGRLYASSYSSHSVVRVDGSSGAYIDTYIPSGTGGLSGGYYPLFLPEQRVTVTPVNDAPVLSAIEGSTLAYTENDPAIIISTSITVADIDNTTISSAVIKITGNYQNGEDLLAFSDTANITSSWDSATGSLTLSGSDTRANYQTALRAVTYANVSNNPSTLNRTVTFTVNDGGLDSNTQTRNITVTAVNDEQSLDTNSGLALNEGASTTITSAMLATSDVDNTAVELVYTVTTLPANGQLELTTNSGVGIASFTQDDIDSNRLVYVHDGSETTSDSFAFSVDDGSGAVSTGTFSISVTLVNENAPVITAAQSFSISELASVGDSVGMVSATDVDTGSTLSGWSITGGNADGIFAIDSSTGEITITDNTHLDFDTTPGYTLSLTVSDGTNTSATETVSIAVNDVTTAITAAQSFTIAEDVVNGDAVGSVVTTGDAPTSFSITAGNTGTAFAIDNSGNITVADATAIDYETLSSYTLTIDASDGTTTVSETVSVTITDVNESVVGAVSDSNAAANSVLESASVGDAVGITAQASDPDGTDTVTYSLSDDAGGLFSIDSSTGVVKVAGALDAETATSHSITVLATSSDTSTSSQSYTISVSDVDEFDVGAVSDVDAAGSTVAENAAVGSTVGITASASDADVTDGVTYSLSDNAGGLFAIDTNSGVVTVASALDYESTTSHNIAVLATSSDGSTSSTVFTITVSDVNDNAPPITAGQSFSISELASVGDSVGAVSATDVDTGTTLSDWSIVGGNADGVFGIDSSTGEIRIADTANLDFDTTPSYTLSLTVSDGSNTSAVETVAISIVDQVIAIAAGQSFSIAENAVNGDAVGTVLTTGDAPQSFSINAGNIGSAFAIDNAGNITVADASAIDYESVSSYTLIVEAFDGSSSVSGAISVALINLNEAPQLNLPPALSVDEDSPLIFSGNNQAGLSVSDPDAGNQAIELTLSVEHGSVSFPGLSPAGADASVSLDAAGKTVVLTGSTTAINAALEQLVFRGDLDFNGVASIEVVVDDKGNTGAGGPLRVQDLISIVVNPVNDLPEIQVPEEIAPLLPGESLSFAENLGGLLKLADVDAQDIQEQVVISAPSGSLHIAETGGLTFAEGSGTGTLVIEGSLLELNKALKSLIFTPEPGFTGDISLTLEARDPGGVEVGAPVISSVSLTFNVRSAVALNPPAMADVPPVDPPERVAPTLPTMVAQAPYTQQTEPGRMARSQAASDETNVFLNWERSQSASTSLSPQTEPLVDGQNRKHEPISWAARQMKLISTWLEPDSDAQSGQSYTFLLPAANAGGDGDNALEGSLTLKAIEIGAAGATIGTALWILRGGSLLASLLLSYPAWRNFDPLPVLASGEEGDDSNNKGNEDKDGSLPHTGEMPTSPTPADMDDSPFLMRSTYDARV
ncbi:MAG: cadherin domain-containing protein [bacterium]